MGYFARLKQRVELFLFKRWDKRGRFPMWAVNVWPYLHWCPGMDDMLVDDPGDCFCDHIPDEIKVEARRVWLEEIAAKEKKDGKIDNGIQPF